MNAIDRALQNRIFRAGYDHGKIHGPCSPREAESELLRLKFPLDDTHVSLFCNGADDGDAGDDFRLRNLHS